MTTATNIARSIADEPMPWCDPCKCYHHDTAPCIKRDSKFVYVCLNVNVGERGFYSHAIHEVPAKTRLAAFAKSQAREFYEDKPERDGNKFIFFDGEIVVSVESWKEATQAEAEVLKKFLG